MAQQTSLERPRTLIDVLDVPLIGRLLRWRWGRLTLQIPFLLIAALLIYDGFTGPDRAAQNLATLVPWVHYRGVIVVVILLAGNLFCMGCPFTIPRTLAKRLSLTPRRFPRLLRNKWLAFAALFALFFLYEWLNLWSSPALTAWVIVAYFAASFALEAIFGESAFCKYVCPLGTFNFVYSTASPLQITAKNTDVCRSCVGKECVNGSYSPQTVIRLDAIPTLDGGTIDREVVHSPQGTPGCGTQLFVPQIRSNLDCVFCLDCVRACPHDNVALAVRQPGREWFQPDAWPKRWDLSLLVIGLGFMGIVNAFGMIPPVYDLMQSIARALGLVDLGLANATIDAITLLILFGVGGALMPAGLAWLAARITRALTRTVPKYNQRETVAAFAPAFVPVGFGIWIAHYGFHFLTGALAIIPVFQNFLLDHRIRILGEPDWSLAGIDNFTVIGAVQVMALLGGFLWSLIIAQRTALRLYRRRATNGLLPWALIFFGMMAAAIWIFAFNEMEMRGTILFD
jgi:polyferredoxin